MVRTANIAGAGIGGLTAAIALAQQGVAVEVFERTAHLGEIGAGLQLSPNAMKVLVALGLEQQLRDVAFEPEFATIRNGITGSAYVRAPLRGHALAAFGAPYLHVHRADLHDILYREAQRLGVSIELKHNIEHYDSKGFFGAKSADICIDASGVKSKIAQKMNPAQNAQFTGQIAWRGLVETGHLPRSLVPRDATVWTGKNRHIVTYYLRGGSLVNFVAVEERANWSEADWTTTGDVDLLRTAFSEWHPAIGTLLESARSANIWALHDKPELTRWSDGCVVLLGDACHPTLPFLAQGAALAIEDAYVLAECLTGVADLRAAVQKYESLRKPRATMLQRKARKNADLFHLTGPISGLASHAKLSIARCLPSKLTMIPFNNIYSYDALDEVASSVQKG